MFRKRTRSLSFGRRKASYKKTFPNKGVMKRCASLIRKMRPLELKNVYSHVSDAVISYDSPYNVLLSGMSQGDGRNERTGNEVFAKNLFVRYRMHMDPEQADLYSAIRVAIVHDKQAVADTIPEWTDVFGSADSDLTPLMSIENMGRFRVLWDKIFKFDADNPVVFGSVYLRLGFPVRFNGTSATDCQKNSVFLVAISTNPAATTPPVLSFGKRFTYSDS